MSKKSKWVGMTVAFESAKGEGSVAFKGKITKASVSRVYVEVKGKHKAESGWLLKSYLEEQE